jgi:hypothetical protein
MRSPGALILLLAVLLPLACKDATAPRIPTTIQLSETELALNDGDTRQLSAKVLDQHGVPFETLADGVQLAWSSSDSAVVSVTATGAVSALRRGAVQVSARAGDALARVAITISPVAAAVRQVSGSGQAAPAGSVLPDSLVARVVDRHGEGVGGVELRWAVTTGGGTIAVSTPGTDAQGYSRATFTLGTTAGTNQVEVRLPAPAPAPIVTFQATASPGPIVSVDATPDTAVLVGGTVQLSAAARDAYGNVVVEGVTSWATSDAAIATVDAAGMAQGRAAGKAKITATRGGVTATTQLTVLRVVPRIDAISPDTLLPGVAATITGANLGIVTKLTLAGVPVTVTSTTATQLRFTVPARSALPCEPSRATPLIVQTGDAADTVAHPLRVATQRSLRVGESLSLLDAADVRCNELSLTGGRYVVSVFNTSTALGAQASFQFRGVGDGGVSSAPASFLVPERPVSARPAPGSRMLGGISPAGEHAQERAHAKVLEQNRRLIERLGMPRRALEPTGLATDRARTRAVAAVGDTLTLRMPWLSQPDICASYITVRARTVYVGTRSVVLEDIAAPLAGTMDEDFRQVGREFDDVMFDILQQNFGNPLAMDAQLDADGRVMMLFSKAVNDLGGVAGFVFSGDFYDRALCESSDQAEVFYAMVPTSQEGGYVSGSRAQWLRTMRSTIIHEVKHVTSFAERIARKSPVLEESWLEESTARISEELWARAVFGYSQNSNVGYAASAYCEVRPTWSECAGSNPPYSAKPYVMMKHFGTLYGYYGAVERLSPLGSTGPGDFSFYSSGWSLIRWAIDHHGGSEAVFLRALTQERTLSGVRNLEARTGRTFPEMLGDWSLAHAVDDYPGFVPARSQLSHPSWNTREIFETLSGEFPAVFPRAFPLATRPVTFGTFAVDVPALRAGSAAIFELSGVQRGKQLLEVRGAEGSAPAATLRIAIVRIE